MVVERWRHYLKYDHFIIKIDHESLKYLLEQKIYSSIQRKGLIKLLRLRYQIHYKIGKENKAADALSRRVAAVGDTNMDNIGDLNAILVVVSS